MNNIPHAAARLRKRPGKEDCFLIIKKISTGQEITEAEAAILYAFFLPPKVKKAASVFEWVSLACDNKSNYAFANYVYCDGVNAMAANPTAAHVCAGDTLGMNVGFYDTKKGAVGDDVAVMPTEANKVLFDPRMVNVSNDSISDWRVVDTPSGISYELPWCGRVVSKKYIDSIIEGLDVSYIGYGDGDDTPVGIHGVFNGSQVSAVFMPQPAPKYQSED